MIDFEQIDARLAEYAEILSALAGYPLSLALTPASDFNPEKNTNSQYLARMELGAEETAYILHGFSPENTNEPINLTQFEAAIDALNKLIQEDINNQFVTNGMAHELAVRYEELNMFYGLESVTHNSSESYSDIDVLRDLINSCQDYIPVDFIGIWVPTEKTEIFTVEDISNEEIRSIKDYLKNIVLKSLKHDQSTWVINHNETTDYLHAANTSFKFIISPIISVDKTTIGILVLCNKLDKPDFTNSDRKLCDVLASEASSILARKRDKLTGLLNKHGFEATLNNILSHQDQTKSDIYVIQMNIDQFRIINDMAGVQGGDRLLQQLASILHLSYENQYVIARTAADVFNMIIDGEAHYDIHNLANELKKSLSEFSYVYENKFYDIKSTIGITKVTGEFENPLEILKALELACQKGKSLGGDRVEFYNPDDESFIEHSKLADGVKLIKDAMQNDRVVLYAQEIYSTDKQLHPEFHYEVLVRIYDENNQIISPALFIPAAEEYKMMRHLDQHILKTAVNYLQEWNKTEHERDIILSINVSGQSIGHDEFFHFAEELILNSNIPPEQICFEVTETAAVENLTLALKFINRMKSIGCSFALDDFGTGMSSFNYLKNIPVDYLKIDGCFIKDILSNRIDKAMVQSIHSIGHEMGLKTIAEYVENKEIASVLTDIGIDYLQGYGVHKPEPLDNIIQSCLPSLAQAQG